MDIAGQIIVVLGAVTFVTAGLGIIRFPDIYMRASAVSTAAGFGVAMVVVGAAVLDPSLSTAWKTVAIIALQLATAAVGSIAIARAGYLTGVPMARRNFNEIEEPSHLDSDPHPDAGQRPRQDSNLRPTD